MLKELIKPPPLEIPDEKSLDSRMNDFISQKWQDLRAAYWQYHSWIWESLLMYSGCLWLRWDANRKGYVVDTPENDFTPRPRINRFAPAIDAVASNFQAIPDIEAVAAPRDSVANIGIAEICNELSTHLIKDLALRSDFRTDEDKVSLAGQWFTLAGSFFTNVYIEEVPIGERPVEALQPAVGMQCTQCDTFLTATPEEAQASGGACPQCGGQMELTETERMMPQQNEDGSPMMEPLTEKRVRCVIEEPLAGYPRAGARSMRDAGFIILANRFALDEIWSRFGIEDAHADSEYPDGWNTAAENALNFFYLGYANADLSGKDAAMVIRLYMEPGKVKEFPEGAYAIYINGECKKCEPWPFEQEHPLTKGDFRPLPTLFFPRSVAFDICGVMREFLDYSAIIKLHGMTTAVDPWIVDDSTNVSEITGRGDLTITWTSRGPGSKEPHHAGAGHLDNGIYEMRKLHLEDIEQIAQTVAVWRGEKPAGANSGKALDALRIQAAAMFAGPTKNFANVWKETIRKAVKLAQKHYTDNQLIAICGENRIADLQEFRRADLDSCVEWIATEQGMPRTREERRNEMIELYDRGMLDVNDPGVRETAFELFGETGMLGTFNKDAQRARWENSSMKSGGMPVFMPEVDDNAVHLAIHGEDIKSMDFLSRSPEAKEIAIQHFLETQQHVAAQQQAQQAAVQQAQAQPGKPPQPAAQPPQGAPQ
jgi:hypothetical protein